MAEHLSGRACGQGPPACPYVPTPESFRCPADRGADIFGWRMEPTVFDTSGCSYRFNGYLPDDYQNINLADDPVYNLGAKKESWPPQPSRFIMLHEFAAYPFDNNNTIEVTRWHGTSTPGKTFDATSAKGIPGQLVAPALFVDGRAQQCDFTANIKSNPYRALEPGKDWMWYKPVK